MHFPAAFFRGGRNVWEVPQQRVYPAPKTRDTQGAVADLKTAWSYTDDWENNTNPSVPSLKFAAKYIESAAQKDPDAEIPIKDSKTVSVTQLAGLVLFCEGCHLAKNPINHKYAIEPFTKAISYQPSNGAYYFRLASLFLDMNNREDAITVTNAGLAADLNNIDLRKISDRIGANPDAGVKPPIFAVSPWPWFLISWPIGIAGIPLGINSGSWTPFFLCLAVACVGHFIGVSIENKNRVQ
jgi:hypothetical protein